jgi:hypothetical protein
MRRGTRRNQAWILFQPCPRSRSPRAARGLCQLASDVAFWRNCDSDLRPARRSSQRLRQSEASRIVAGWRSRQSVQGGAATFPRPLGRLAHDRLRPVGRGGEDRGAEAEGQGLTPRGNEAAVLLRYGRPEGRAGMGEPTPDPGRRRQTRVRELELQRDRLDTAAGRIDEIDLGPS